MKLADVGIFVERGVISIREVNKRGIPKAGGIDITRQVVELFIDVCTTPEKKVAIYQRDDKFFSIDIKQLTDEEVAGFQRTQPLKSHKISLLLAQMAAFANAHYIPFR